MVAIVFINDQRCVRNQLPAHLLSISPECTKRLPTSDGPPLDLDLAFGSGVDSRHFMAESEMDFERVLVAPKLIRDSSAYFPGVANYFACEWFPL